MKPAHIVLVIATLMLCAPPAFADTVNDTWVGKRVVFKDLNSRDIDDSIPDHFAGDKMGLPSDDLHYNVLHGYKGKIRRVVRVGGKPSYVVVQMDPDFAPPPANVVSVRIQANGNAPGLGLYVPPAKLPVTMVLGTELGGVKLGAASPSTTREAAKARFGRPKIEIGTTQEGTFFWGDDPNYPSFGYKTFAGRVVSLTTSDPVFKTAQGIGVGSRLSKVKAVYPGGRMTAMAFATPPTYIVKRGGHTTTFTLYKDEVQAIEMY